MLPLRPRSAEEFQPVFWCKLPAHLKTRENTRALFGRPGLIGPTPEKLVEPRWVGGESRREVPIAFCRVLSSSSSGADAVARRRPSSRPPSPSPLPKPPSRDAEASLRSCASLGHSSHDFFASVAADAPTAADLLLHRRRRLLSCTSYASSCPLSIWPMFAWAFLGFPCLHPWVLD